MPIAGFYSSQDDPHPVRFSSGDVLKITLRGLGAPAAPASAVREVGAPSPTEGTEELGTVPVAVAGAALGASALFLVLTATRRRRAAVAP